MASPVRVCKQCGRVLPSEQDGAEDLCKKCRPRQEAPPGPERQTTWQAVKSTLLGAGRGIRQKTDGFHPLRPILSETPTVAANPDPAAQPEVVAQTVAPVPSPAPAPPAVAPPAPALPRAPTEIPDSPFPTTPKLQPKLRSMAPPSPADAPPPALGPPKPRPATASPEQTSRSLEELLGEGPAVGPLKMAAPEELTRSIAARIDRDRPNLRLRREAERAHLQGDWFVNFGRNVVRGPFTWEELVRLVVNGELEETGNVRLGESGEWQRAGGIEELFSERTLRDRELQRARGSGGLAGKLKRLFGR